MTVSLRTKDHERDKVMFMRLITTIQAMKMHLNSGGKMRLTRVATPTNLRSIATEFTGKSYPRSKQGMATALADLEKLREETLGSPKAEAQRV